MRVRLLAGLALTTIVSGAAQAQLLSTTGSATINGLGTEVSFTNLAQFDPSLGTLLSVTEIIGGTRSADYTVTSARKPLLVPVRSDTETIYLVGSSGSIGNSLTGIGLPAVEAPGSTFNYTIGGLGGSLLLPTSDFGILTGTGSLQVSGWLGAPTINGATEVYHSGGATSSVTLIYNYRAAVGDVPEPATWASMMAGLAVTGAALRRRQKAFRQAG